MPCIYHSTSEPLNKYTKECHMANMCHMADMWYSQVQGMPQAAMWHSSMFSHGLMHGEGSHSSQCVTSLNDALNVCHVSHL